MNEVSLKPVIDELETLFSKFNKAFFEGKLEKPVITVSPDHTRGAYGWCTGWKAWQDGTKEGGYYEINLCAEYLNRPFEETCGTLLHEMFHRVDEAVCVLTDINSFISITDEKSSDFSSNQTIRVLDQIANDIAVLFGKKYLGKVPNDAAGRISLWNDIVKHHTELQDIRAIENFSGENVTVEKGDTKKSVVVTDYVTPVNAMEQLYMTVYVQ